MAAVTSLGLGKTMERKIQGVEIKDKGDASEDDEE